jgi:hypothetical protein
VPAGARQCLAPAYFRRCGGTTDEQETAMAEWTQAEEAQLVDGFRDGTALDELAAALGKTPGSVRWKLTQLGLDSLPCAPPGTSKPQYDEQHLAHRRGDLAFKRAMLEAIRAGAERAEPVVIRSRVGHYVRRVIPVIESGYRSSAGYTAEMGVDHGGTSGQGGNS